MKRRWIAVLALGTACSETVNPRPGVTPAQLCATFISSIAATNQPNINDIYDALAPVLPGGFAGNTTTTVFLTQPAMADTMRGSVRTLAACDKGDLDSLFAVMLRSDVRPVRYSWLQLREWSRRILSPGATGLNTWGIDVGQNRIDLGADSQASVDMWRARARSMDIPDDAISITVIVPRLVR